MIDIDADVPNDFGLTQVWWGNGKGKTTSAIGMGVRAVGHGYRVHMMQFMKGGTDTIHERPGEYTTIENIKGFTYENWGQYGWHIPEKKDEKKHKEKARQGFKRTKELLGIAQHTDIDRPLELHRDPSNGFHMLIVDEILYTVNRGFIDKDEILEIIKSKPKNLELILTGAHKKPEYLYDYVDLISHVKKEKHPFDKNKKARKGTEY